MVRPLLQGSLTCMVLARTGTQMDQLFCAHMSWPTDAMLQGQYPVVPNLETTCTEHAHHPTSRCLLPWTGPEELEMGYPRRRTHTP